MKLVLTRHGESQWNLENRFTGWVDVDITDKGRQEAIKGGQTLKELGLTFDVAYTSYQKRAIKTLNLFLEELNKAETAEKYGDEQVHIWRRSFDVAPPQVDKNSDMYPGNIDRYKDIPEGEIPTGESLKLTIDRVLPYWESDISKQIKAGKNVLISAHGNSLRALIKYLLNISDEKILDLNLPTGTPLVFEIDENLNIISAPELF